MAAAESPPLPSIIIIRVQTRNSNKRGTRTSANTPCKFVERSTRPPWLSSIENGIVRPPREKGGEELETRPKELSFSLSLPARSDLLKIYPRARNHLSIDGLERVLNFERLRFRRGCWFSTVLAFDLLPLDAISCPPPLPAMEEIRQGRIFLRLFLCFSFELPRTEFISPVLSSFQFSFVERIDLKGFFFFFVEFLSNYSVNLKGNVGEVFLGIENVKGNGSVNPLRAIKLHVC